MATRLPLYRLSACVRCGQSDQGTRAKAGNSVRCLGCDTMRRVPADRPTEGPDDFHAIQPRRGAPFESTDPRRGPGVPSGPARPPAQTAPRPAPAPRPPAPIARPPRPAAPARRPPAPARRTPARPAIRPQEPEAQPSRDVGRVIGEMLAAFIGRPPTTQKAPVQPRQRPVPANPVPRPVNPRSSPVIHELTASDQPLNFSLPPVYMACTECVSQNTREASGLYGQAGIYVRIWNKDTGLKIAEGNLCRTHYREFVKLSRGNTGYYFNYSRDLRPGI
jgi:hypothetical protein